MSREQELIEAYEGWEPDEETITDFVERIGISRQRLYQVLDKHGVVPKTKRASQGNPVPGDLLTEMAEMALGYLVNQLAEARQELAEYRQKYGAL